MLKIMALTREERERMGQAGRIHIEEYYSLDRVVNQWVGLYRELLASKGYKIYQENKAIR